MICLCVYGSFFLFILVDISGTDATYDFKHFDDTVLFKINWPGKTVTDLLDYQAIAEPYTVTSSNNEQYQCFIPETVNEDNKKDNDYKGPTPIEFLSLLFGPDSCSFRLESYWTYEVCHGRYVQQYHEERDGKKIKVQKYDLGKLDSMQITKLNHKYEELAKNPNRKSLIPTKKIDGVNMPYIEMEMTDGSLCDLNNKPRSIKVLYVCYQAGKQEIYSMKETAICEYETIILTPLLCSHPDYKPQESEEKKINCRPIENAPKKPRSLIALEAESAKLRHQKILENEKSQKVYAIFRVDKDGQDGHPQLRVQILPADSSGSRNALDHSLNPLIEREETSVANSDSVENFLSGRNCLTGGNGWWRYEFCYGQSVIQYHTEKGGSKTVVRLGEFNRDKHIQWIEANQNKKPKPVEQRNQLSHFYGGGTMCDKTGSPRQTEVKLKCVKNSMGSSSSVSLYLLEPKICEYVLGVESPLICDILKHADNDYGLLSDTLYENLQDVQTDIGTENEDIGDRIANGDE